MHRLLDQQVKGLIPAEAALETFQSMLQAVDQAYQSFESERQRSEQSMLVASEELVERNLRLQERHAQIQSAHAALQGMRDDLKRLAGDLEARVAERTAELQCANQVLVTDIAERKKVEETLRETEAKFRSMFENATDGIFQTTADGRYLACNPALARIYGYGSPDELIESMRDLGRQLYVDDRSRPEFVRVMKENGQVWGFEARVYRKDRSIIWIAESAREVRDANGRLCYYEGFVSDITARKQAEEALRESEERYALAVQGASVGLWDWNLRTAQIHFSARWKEMLGCTDEQIGTLPEEWFNRVHPQDLQALQTAITSHREGLTPCFETEHRMRHQDGGYRWMLSRGMAIRDEAGNATRMAGSQTDVTARKEAEEQLIRDALHDGLTGLPNRVLFTDRLERSLARIARDPDHHFAVLFLDLDRFKGINDSLGHAVGDELLVTFAKRLTSCLRPSDTVARLGGDEFTVLLEDPHAPDDAAGVADRILEVLRSPFMLGTHEVFVTSSIGIALSSANYTRPQEILRDADTAMYRAKALGKSRYQIFDTAMHAGAVKQLLIENDLRRAIDRNEFELYYQPIQNIESGRVSGFEALIRWKHPERGLIPPSDFIPVSEDTGLIVPIGQWVLHEACRQTAEWHASFPENLVDINVNLSGKQFAQPDLVEQVMSALNAASLPAQHLILEITESVVMVNPQATITMLNRLKNLGVQINIDDFGTGYSSLAYLQQFPVDTMKIDKSFIARMNRSAEGLEIVRTIIELAHNMNMKVTAEGIESADQLSQLAGLNCEHAQGYFLSRPLKITAATELLQAIQPDGAAAA
jgi:diguanylate cyclase (GGDEF)-like protein/PAS domain S-box-containing protein